eukprot:CAMPEP_0184646932 /NCGR_PEP_ID=MMETSP0308-20130426/3755_1 /TAXON_ID=38269 /ORGANISM="Gloeochaete witrockiana, Strain SAG 46.84" /LENGTH=60 /DNA_ID=CAMNT_0027077437 /DNA_START=633 /DNA_END=815 /DNA_ORIENTATION=-
MNHVRHEAGHDMDSGSDTLGTGFSNTEMTGGFSQKLKIDLAKRREKLATQWSKPIWTLEG